MRNRALIVTVVSMGILLLSGIVLTKRMRQTRDEQTVFAIKLASAAHITINSGKSRSEFLWTLQECLGQRALIIPLSVAEVREKIQSELKPRELLIGSKSGECTLITVVIVQGVSNSGRLFGQAASVDGRNAIQLERVDVGDFEWLGVTIK